MQSLLRAWEFACAGGLKVEVLVVRDRPDSSTLQYFSRYEGRPGIAQLDVDVGDLGLARNAGIAQAQGSAVSILDADNLMAENWLMASWSYLQSASQKVIAHPEYQVVFEAQDLIFRQISMDHPLFDVRNIIEFNYWDAMCMAPREIFIECPYEPTMQGRGFGFEDWHWNCQTIAHGYDHFVVPNTVHFIRAKRSGSLLASTRQANRIVRPSQLFDPSTFEQAVQRSGK